MIIKIPIPVESKCLLKVGQKVTFDTPFLEKKTATDIHVPLAKTLRIPPSKIFRYLKKFVGDHTEKGEALANKKTLLSSQTIICEYAGIIKEINHVEGVMIISVFEGKKNSITSYFTGEVVEMKKDELSLKVNEGKEYMLKTVSTDFGAETFYLKDDNAQLTDMKIQNKILICESLSSYSQTKAEALGATGFISVRDPSDTLTVFYAMLKSAEDLKKIFQSHLPYCLADKKSSRIYFYA